MDRPGDAEPGSSAASPSTIERLCLYLQVGVVGGAMALLVVLLLAIAAGAAVGDGEYRWLALAVLLLLVGGPFSLLYLLPVATEPEARAELTEGMPGYEHLSAREAAVAVALGAVAIAAAVAVDPWALAGLLALVFLASLLASLHDPDWSFDAEERTLTYHGGDGDLDAVTDHRRLDVRGRALLWLSYAGPNEVGRPRLLVLPSAVADDVLAVVPEEPPEEEETRPADERVAIAGTGLLFLALAAGLAALARESARADSAALVVFAGTPALIGALLLYLAR